MNKTNTLLERYLRLFNEQDQETPQPQSDATQEPKMQSLPTSGASMPANQKYMIKILTNAFIFNPALFDTQVQKNINDSIQRLSKSVNVPISKIVSDITDIICLDKSLCGEIKNPEVSLRAESKTQNYINRLMYLIEQPADATEPQQDDTSSQQGDTQAAPSVEKKNELKLEEIFPLYRELILKALAHTPTDEELMMLKPVVDEFTDIDPSKIENFIAKTLNQSLEDSELEDNLGELETPVDEPEIELSDV